MLFALRRTSRAASLVPGRATDFHATLLSGALMTLAGVFGLVAESVAPADSHWWLASSYALQALGALIVQLAVIQLLTPDYLFGLLSIAAPPNGKPSWRIYALIFAAVTASVASLISVFIVPHTPSLPSSIPSFISACLPLPFLLSLAQIVKSARVGVQDGHHGPTVYTKRSSKCVELGLACGDTKPSPVTLRFPRIWEFAFVLQSLGAVAGLCEIAEAALDQRIIALQLLAAIAKVVWGGGVMAIHFVIIYEPTYQCSSEHAMVHSAQHDLGRVAEQPSEDFMTLRDPFASPTQVGLPLPPSPSTPRRKPKRRASEPLQLTRFGSLALHGTSDEKAAPEVDPDTQFLEALVRHALFSTGLPEVDSTATLAQVPTKAENGRPASRDYHSGTSTPTIRQNPGAELAALRTPEPAPAPELALPWHTFRPSTPPRPSRVASRVSPAKLAFPEPPSSFPFPSSSSAESGYSVPVTRSRASSYISPSSPEDGSDSGSSFVSPPPTPTPGPSGPKPSRKVRTLVPTRPAPVLSPAPSGRRRSGPP